MTLTPGVVGPVPPYYNVAIESEFYQPSRFVISAISLGSVTTVTTSADHNFVVGNLVRLLIPVPYGTSQLNEQTGYVLSIPATNQVVLGINSLPCNAYLSSPFSTSITGATQTNPCVLTVSNSVSGSAVIISGVTGMTGLNGNTYSILSQNATTITINADATAFSAYTGGGTATIFPIDGRVSQIISVGDINTGAINASGRSSTGTFVPGSFINISPQ